MFDTVLSWVGYFASNAAVAVPIYIGSSVLFDAIHWLAHTKTPGFGWLRRWHWGHHRFFGPDLVFDDKFLVENMVFHLTLEFAAQFIAICACCWWLWPEYKLSTAGVTAVSLIRWVVQLIWIKGKDEHHLEIGKSGNPLLAPLDSLMAPRAFGRAWVELLTPLCGQGNVKTIKFGVDWDFNDYSKLKPIFQSTDILILSHGAKGSADDNAANVWPFVTMIDMFEKVCTEQKRLLFPEVWAVGSDVESGIALGVPESYKSSKRLFSRYAKGYYQSSRIFYRHIVPGAFSSQMGPGLISAKTAARWALLFINRGFRYIPVTYTGLSYISWIKFAWFDRPLVWDGAANDRKSK